MGLELVNIKARDLPDAWFQCVYEIFDKGHEYVIDHGSYAGQKRLEFDYITVHIKYPGTIPLIPDIPTALGLPPPVAENYLDEYLLYLMTSNKQPNEDYTYGERLVGWRYFTSKIHPNVFDDEAKAVAQPRKLPVFPKSVNQIDEVIEMYKTKGFGTNQAAISISCPSDIFLEDPPCLRHLDTRIKDNKLHFMVYFRSWELWNGFPANLGGIQLLKQYMASEIGIEDGEIIAASKGLHLYDYAWELAKKRTGRV